MSTSRIFASVKCPPISTSVHASPELHPHRHSAIACWISYNDYAEWLRTAGPHRGQDRGIRCFDPPANHSIRSISIQLRTAHHINYYQQQRSWFIVAARPTAYRSWTAARVYQDFRYQTRKSWSRDRRVIGKAEHLAKGAKPRFVFTGLSTEDYEAATVYEK
ncbi:transposase [Bythopirellula polymerisocia]|uniref:transposase n=1 Tax=Bythopirellula polymerisocia TaxID=2528003 RepID=UPI0018D4AF33|nr:transposase [Bythopirellula polymerisocia]